MPATYVEINKEEFEEALNSYGFEPAEDITSKEIGVKELVYAVPIKDRVHLKIFSSIDVKTFKTREVGSDAIRVIPMIWSNKQLEWRILKGLGKRTNRTTNWRSNLYDNIINTIKSLKSNYKPCVCGGVLVIRQGKFGKFWGCLDYPKCKNAESILSDSK